MLNFILWIIVGAVIGWVASIIMRTNRQQGLIMDILVGIVGAFLAGIFLSPLFGTGTINTGDFSLGALLVSLAGAVVLLALMRIFRGLFWLILIVALALLAYAWFSCSVQGSAAQYCATFQSLVP